MPPSPAGSHSAAPQERQNSRTYRAKRRSVCNFFHIFIGKPAGQLFLLLPPPALPYQRVPRSLPQPDPVRPAEGPCSRAQSFASYQLQTFHSGFLYTQAHLTAFAAALVQKRALFYCSPGPSAAGAGASAGAIPVRRKSSLTAGLLPPVLPPELWDGCGAAVSAGAACSGVVSDG